MFYLVGFALILIRIFQFTRSQLFNELLEVVYEVVHLIDGKLLDADGGDSSDGGDDSFVKSPESRAFYIKMKADYYRYVAEVAHGDSKRRAFVTRVLFVASLTFGADP